MNAIAENMPRPTARPSAVATTKVRLPNSDSGMIGSAARSSTSDERDDRDDEAGRAAAERLPASPSRRCRRGR